MAFSKSKARATPDLAPGPLGLGPFHQGLTCTRRGRWDAVGVEAWGPVTKIVDRCQQAVSTAGVGSRASPCGSASWCGVPEARRGALRPADHPMGVPQHLQDVRPFALRQRLAAGGGFGTARPRAVRIIGWLRNASSPARTESSTRIACEQAAELPHPIPRSIEGGRAHELGEGWAMGAAQGPPPGPPPLRAATAGA